MGPDDHIHSVAQEQVRHLFLRFRDRPAVLTAPVDQCYDHFRAGILRRLYVATNAAAAQIRPVVRIIRIQRVQGVFTPLRHRYGIGSLGVGKKRKFDLVDIADIGAAIFIPVSLGKIRPNGTELGNGEIVFCRNQAFDTVVERVGVGCGHEPEAETSEGAGKLNRRIVIGFAAKRLIVNHCGLKITDRIRDVIGGEIVGNIRKGRVKIKGTVRFGHGPDLICRCGNIPNKRDGSNRRAVIELLLGLVIELLQIHIQLVETLIGRLSIGSVKNGDQNKRDHQKQKKANADQGSAPSALAAPLLLKLSGLDLSFPLCPLLRFDLGAVINIFYPAEPLSILLKRIPGIILICIRRLGSAILLCHNLAPLWKNALSYFTPFYTGKQ